MVRVAPAETPPGEPKSLLLKSRPTYHVSFAVARRIFAGTVPPETLERKLRGGRTTANSARMMNEFVIVSGCSITSSSRACLSRAWTRCVVLPFISGLIRQRCFACCQKKSKAEKTTTEDQPAQRVKHKSPHSQPSPQSGEGDENPKQPTHAPCKWVQSDWASLRRWTS